MRKSRKQTLRWVFQTLFRPVLIVLIKNPFASFRKLSFHETERVGSRIEPTINPRVLTTLMRWLLEFHFELISTFFYFEHFHFSLESERSSKLLGQKKETGTITSVNVTVRAESGLLEDRTD